MDWPLIRIWIAIFGVMIHWKVAEGSISGWKKTPTQYHVQTDEGTERYFRFQTYNGQYRRERRLDDGTVVGSYGWVDPTGFLRMTDYIADSKGYRVVKEFMEFVGTNSIDEGPTKYSPSKQSLRVAKPLGIFETKKPTGYYSSPSTDAAVVATTEKPLVAYVSTRVPRVPSGFYETPNNSAVLESPHRRPSPPSRRVHFQATPVTPPANALVPPRAPPRVLEIAPLKTSSPQTANTYTYVPAMSNYARRPSSNSLYFKGASSAERQYEPRSNVTLTPAPHRLVSRRPVVIIRNHNTPEEVPESAEGKEDVFQAYATPLRTGTGFLYKVPHQYHKEETEIDGSRTGSFGYIDPYGIRRVIHYNAGQAGFQHLRDFKFVGRQY